MKGYEAIVILDPNLNNNKQAELINQFKGLVAQHGGAVLHQSEWGKRRLAYKIRKQTHGSYHLLYIDYTPTALNALEKNFRINEQVLKWLSVKVENTEKEFLAFEKLKIEGSGIVRQPE